MALINYKTIDQPNFIAVLKLVQRKCSFFTGRINLSK